MRVYAIFWVKLWFYSDEKWLASTCYVNSRVFVYRYCNLVLVQI